MWMFSSGHSPLADIRPESAATVNRTGYRWLRRHGPDSHRCSPRSCPKVLPPPPGTAGRLICLPGLRDASAWPRARLWRRRWAFWPLNVLWGSAGPLDAQRAASCPPPAPWWLLLLDGRNPPLVGLKECTHFTGQSALCPQKTKKQKTKTKLQAGGSSAQVALHILT